MSNNKGYTLIELVVTMGIFIVVIMITSYAFQNILQRTATQMKTSESNIDGVVGLELMRSDLEHSGYGLPWSFMASPTAYIEVGSSSDSLTNGLDSKSFNDVPPLLPRAVVSGTNTDSSSTTNSVPGSDYLVIKSTRVALDGAVKKWNYVSYSSAGSANMSFLKTWGAPGNRISSDWVAGERVIAINSTFTTEGVEDKQLAVKSDGSFYYAIPTYSATPGAWAPPDDAFKPADSSKLLLVYGVADPAGSTALRMPYNRTDYYIDTNAPRPASCSPGTGSLTKAVVNHATGGFIKYPLLDCVGDLQVAYYLDMNDDGNPGTYANATGSIISTTEGASLASVQATLGSAASLRTRLKQVFVYILGHEGGKDRNFAYPVADVAKVITVGDPSLNNIGRIWTQTKLAAIFGADWRNYRWKVYTIVVKPKNIY